MFTARGVATLNFNNSAMGTQDAGVPRGTGTFYDLYGPAHAAGSMMAWAWGVSRIIDALERTPAANIDPRRIAVTGCSRNGKGALISGAFDERIALTIPQESGTGGSASWRVSEAQRPEAGTAQTLTEAHLEQPWFRDSFGQFGAAVSRLPFDHHQLLGLVAPRPLLVIDNSSLDFLGTESGHTSALAASQIWAGLGVSERMGSSQVGGHSHCAQIPQSQLDELGAFVDRFLLADTAADTSGILHTDRIEADRNRWLPWTTPALP